MKIALLVLPLVLAAAAATPVATTTSTPKPPPRTPAPEAYLGTPVLAAEPTPTLIETRCAKKKKKNTWLLTRSGRDEILANRLGLKFDTRASDYFADGKRSGTVLTSVLGGFGASCGFELGDIVKTVNGIDADDDHLAQIEAEVKKAKRIEIELMRDGKKKTFAYDIE